MSPIRLVSPFGNGLTKSEHHATSLEIFAGVTEAYIYFNAASATDPDWEVVRYHFLWS